MGRLQEGDPAARKVQARRKQLRRDRSYPTLREDHGGVAGEAEMPPQPGRLRADVKTKGKCRNATRKDHARRGRLAEGAAARTTPAGLAYLVQ